MPAARTAGCLSIAIKSITVFCEGAAGFARGGIVASQPPARIFSAQHESRKLHATGDEGERITIRERGLYLGFRRSFATELGSSMGSASSPIRQGFGGVNQRILNGVAHGSAARAVGEYDAAPADRVMGLRESGRSAALSVIKRPPFYKGATAMCQSPT